MFDTLTPRSTTGDFETMPGARPDPGGFLPEARTGAREAAAHMKDLAERFAELRNAIMCLPGNPSRDDRAGLRHRLLHLENTLMSARGSLDDAVIAIMDANDAARCLPSNQHPAHPDRLAGNRGSAPASRTTSLRCCSAGKCRASSDRTDCQAVIERQA